MTKTHVDEALTQFSSGLLCSQSILLTYGPQFGLAEDVAIRIARPFGGGISRTCEMCGAVSGAIMVLGLQEQGEEEKAAKESVYARTQQFIARFTEVNGSVNCAELLGCDLGKPEGQQHFRYNNLVHRCKRYVKDAATILEEVLERKEHAK